MKQVTMQELKAILKEKGPVKISTFVFEDTKYVQYNSPTTEEIIGLTMIVGSEDNGNTVTFQQHFAH